MKDEKKSVGDLDTGAATTTSPIHPNEIRIGDTKYILSKDSHGHYQYTLSKETHPHHQGERYVWRCIWDASKNKPYYWNRSTGNRVWALPAVRVDPLNESKAETRSAAPKVSLRPVRSTLPDTSTNSPCKTEEGCSGASDGVDTRSIGPTVLAVLRKNMQRLKSEGSTEEPQSCGTQNNIPGAQAQSSPKRACGIIAVTDGSSSALPHGSATLQDSVIEHAAPPSTTTLPGKNPVSYSYSFATSYEVPAHDFEATDVNHCVTSGSDSLHREQSLAVSSPDGTTYRDRLHEIRERKARVLSQSQSCIRTDVQLEPGSIESQRANPRSVSVDPHPKESADSGALGRHPVPIGPTIFPHGVMKEPHAYDPSSIIINVNAEGFDTAPPKEMHSQDPASQGPEDSVDDEPLAHNMKTTFTESSRVTQGTPENGGTNHPSKEAGPLTPIELSTYVCDAVHSAYGLASDGIPLGIPFGTHCVLHNGSFQDDTLIPDAFSFTGYADIHLLERNTETEGTNSALEDRRRSIKKSDSTRRCGLVPRIVVAEFDKNVMKSPGNIVFSTGDVLTWKWCNRDRPGTGDVVIQYVNGDVYEGALVNFKKQGEGCLRFKKSGYTYHGMFHHGLMHGQGKLVFLNGSVYEGAFAHQTLSGRATYTARSEIGSVPLFVYDGMFEQGYMHGHGRIEYPNGDIWEGTWKKDKKWMGKYIFSRQFVL